MSSNEILAYKIAVEAFKEKKDKAGKPYFDHISRVAEDLHGHVKICAYLHDLLEDCPEWTEGAIRNLFGNEIATTVATLTKGKDEPYEDYIERISKDSWAVVVKIADLKDNMDVTRLNEITDKDVDRLKKYHKAYKRLTNK